MRVHVGLSVIASLCGCAEPGEDLVAERSRPGCTTIDNRSLVESDPAVVNDARFSLERVFEAIRATTPPGYAVPSVREMFGQLYYDYGMCAGDGADPLGYGMRCRPAESALAHADPFSTDPEGLHFAASAVLGRYDMANARAGTCGESRIVYWKDRGPVTGKAGFIVELQTPPVIDSQGHATCEPVAQFWASLSTIDDVNVRADKLEEYFFEGLPGMAYPPVSARGAGWDGLGQVRSNNFVDNVQWNLRESKWTGVCGVDGCRAKFAIVDVKGSPSDKLFAGTHANAPAFEHWFLSKSVPRLARARTANDLGLGNDAVFNAFEGISQPFADDPVSVLYRQAASADLRGKIAAKLSELGSPLSVDNILDRATAATCAGCHRISRNADLGGGLVFPRPFGFVHVGENGALSIAMVEQFLPARRQLLQDAVCGKNKEPADGETVGGKPVGAAN